MQGGLIKAFRGFVLLMIGSSLIGAALVPNPLQAGRDEPIKAASPIPFTDVNPLGANFFLDREVELWKREQTLTMAREAGIGWVKLLFSWEGIEPKKGRFWDDRLRKSTWDKYDELVSLAQKHGMRIIARLDRAPEWSRTDKAYSTTPPDNLQDYGNFVHEVVNRYRGRVQYYQIWNEPNIWPEWGNRPVDPAGYVKMLRLAYQRAKAADPSAVILGAPLAQTTEENPRNLSELVYLDRMYQAGAKGSFDVLLANGYGFDRPPDDPPDPKVLNFARLKLLRQVMVRHGDEDKPIWINEYGWNASPPDFPKEKLLWRRVSEEEQARYAAEGIRLARSWGWIGVINLWYFRQVGDFPRERSDYYFRAVDVDFTPRPVYYALQNLSRELRVAGPGLHEELSPGVQLRGTWRTLLGQRAGETFLVSEKPGDELLFTFRGTALRLRVGEEAVRGRLYLLGDGQASGSLSRDAEGRSYLDLERMRQEDGSVELVAGLSPGQHTLHLTVGQSPQAPGGQPYVAIDSFEVLHEGAVFSQFYLFGAVVVLGILLLAASFTWGRAR